MDGLRAQWGRAYPGAVVCLVEDFESLTVHLRFPKAHRRRCRHTNLIERTFGETRRRTKVIGRLPGERTCVALVFAVLDRQRKGWRGMTTTPRALRRLQDLRRELLGDQPEAGADNIITAAAQAPTGACAATCLHRVWDATVLTPEEAAWVIQDFQVRAFRLQARAARSRARCRHLYRQDETCSAARPILKGSPRPTNHVARRQGRHARDRSPLSPAPGSCDARRGFVAGRARPDRPRRRRLTDDLAGPLRRHRIHTDCARALRLV
jgi:hypothetical protein